MDISFYKRSHRNRTLRFNGRIDVRRRIMPDLLELNDDLFVAVTEADLAFKEQFLEGCAVCHIPARDISVKRAFEMEPFLNPKTLAAVQVLDGVFEPFRFCLTFLATARLTEMSHA